MESIDKGAEAASGAALLRLVSPVRVTGFALYNTWLLSTFYNTFLFLSAADFREALYLNQMLSLGVLALTLVAFPIVVRHADKWVLSLRLSTAAGALLALFTSLLAFADPDTAVGCALIAASGVGTGVSSGTLFLGWGRLYADVGPRTAMLEVALAWALAGCCAVALSFIAPVAATVIVVAGALASAALLRSAAMHRPERPRPSHTHRLQRRTVRMFVRGLAACALIGLVMGISDVLTGFRFVPVPEHYEVHLAVSCALATVVAGAIVVLNRHDFVVYAYRVATLLLVLGCLLTPFIATTTLSNVVVFGAYTVFVITLSVVCIDISNYFDQPATRTFGFAFCALYAGELLGNGAGHLLTDMAGIDVDALGMVTVVLTAAIVFANLFLFTEKDLTETSLGEMTDDDPVDGRDGWAGTRLRAIAAGTGCGVGGDGLSGTGGAGAGIAWDPGMAGQGAAGPGAAGLATAGQMPGLASAFAAEQRVARITALFVERFGLTPREADVLPLIIKGRTIARIQEELHISQGTVSTHTRHIYQKACVRNRQALLDLIDELPEEDLAEAAGPAGTQAG